MLQKLLLAAIPLAGMCCEIQRYRLSEVVLSASNAEFGRMGSPIAFPIEKRETGSRFRGSMLHYQQRSQLSPQNAFCLQDPTCCPPSCASIGVTTGGVSVGKRCRPGRQSGRKRRDPPPHCCQKGAQAASQGCGCTDSVRGQHARSRREFWGRRCSAQDATSQMDRIPAEAIFMRQVIYLGPRLSRFSLCCRLFSVTLPFNLVGAVGWG